MINKTFFVKRRLIEKTNKSNNCKNICAFDGNRDVDHSKSFIINIIPNMTTPNEQNPRNESLSCKNKNPNNPFQIIPVNRKSRIKSISEANILIFIMNISSVAIIVVNKNHFLICDGILKYLKLLVNLCADHEIKNVRGSIKIPFEKDKNKGNGTNLKNSF